MILFIHAAPEHFCISMKIRKLHTKKGAVETRVWISYCSLLCVYHAFALWLALFCFQKRAVTDLFR